MTTVTCHTPDCGNADQPIDVDLTFTDPDGETHTVDAVVCGVCGNPITDLGAATEAAPEHQEGATP
jgi:hypothetical protein